MLWLIGPIVVVVLVFLAGYQKVALGLLVASVIAGGLIYQRREQTQDHATTRISVSEIALESISLRPTFDASYELTGRIKNNSETYRIDGVHFNVAVSDCRANDISTCVVAGEAATHVVVTVPPQQARNFTGTLYFGRSHRRPKDTLAWNYEITAIVAKRQ